MAPVYFFVIGILALLACSALGVCVWIHRKNKALQKQLTEKTKMVEANAKLLMSKNIELINKNIAQHDTLEAREDFIEIVSHQLRTPSTEIKWQIDELLHEPGVQIPETTQVSFERIAKNAERMVDIIDTLVHLVNLEQGKVHMNIDAYNPNTVVRQVIEAAAQKFAAKKMKVNQELYFEGTIQSIHSEPFEMIVENLVYNAYHYTEAEGEITVRTEKTDDSMVRLSVSDTGLGVPAEKQKMLFEKFQRSDAARHMNSGGMGLGLYIVKNLAERHGGTVGFESTEGVGSTFWCTLPIAARTQPSRTKV